MRSLIAGCLLLAFSVVSSIFMLTTINRKTLAEMCTVIQGRETLHRQEPDDV